MNIAGRLALKMLWRGLRNAFEQRPLSVSFEITHHCTANCWHCNWGGPVKGEQRLGAEEYAAICRELRPVVVNISGGEPLAHSDVCEISRAMAQTGGLPWMVLVTNAAALTADKYWKLREAGINQFSVSLDFPDGRHSEFRRIPGLFDKMERVIPEITALGNNDLSLNVCITAWNYRDLPTMVELARRWNTKINFSVYTPIRINDDRGLAREEQHGEVRDVFQRVIPDGDSWSSTLTAHSRPARWCGQSTDHRATCSASSHRITPARCALSRRGRIPKRRWETSSLITGRCCCSNSSRAGGPNLVRPPDAVQAAVFHSRRCRARSRDPGGQPQLCDPLRIRSAVVGTSSAIQYRAHQTNRHRLDELEPGFQHAEVRRVRPEHQEHVAR